MRKPMATPVAVAARQRASAAVARWVLSVALALIAAAALAEWTAQALESNRATMERLNRPADQCTDWQTGRQVLPPAYGDDC